VTANAEAANIKINMFLRMRKRNMWGVEV